MYVTTLIDNFHGNRESWVSLSKEDVRTHLISHLENWDCDYSQKELESILEKGIGTADEKSKTCLEIEIVEVNPGERF
jgi:hypothetical protein